MFEQHDVLTQLHAEDLKSSEFRLLCKEDCHLKLAIGFSCPAYYLFWPPPIVSMPPHQWRTQDSSGAWAKSTHAQAICLALVMENIYACKLTHAMRALTLEATQIWCLLQTGARARAQGRRALGLPLG
jgi:hypothetical protein